MVRLAGFEPARYFYHQSLELGRLPFRHRRIFFLESEVPKFPCLIPITFQPPAKSRKLEPFGADGGIRTHTE